MSNFYKKYLTDKGVKKEEMPVYMQREINNKELQKMQLNQCNMFTRGKHNGSKSLSKIIFNLHRGTRMIKGMMSGYAE